jgi:hypothetical protein
MAPRTPIKISTEGEPEAGAGVSVPSEPPMPFVRRPGPVTNTIALGQQLADALLAARALIHRTPTDLTIMVDGLRRWYYSHDPAERDRLLWRRFEEARQTHTRLEQAIQAAREALDVERPALAAAEVEREALAARPLPATVQEEATNARPEAVRRYQAVGIECQQRAAAITELERLLPAPEQALGPLTEAVTRLLEAVGTIDRETFVRRLRESGELEHLRSQLERLRTMANTHAAEIDEWSQVSGHPVRVPRVMFPWPPAPVWDALLAEAVESPELIWDDNPKRPGI